MKKISIALVLMMFIASCSQQEENVNTSTPISENLQESSLKSASKSGKAPNLKSLSSFKSESFVESKIRLHVTYFKGTKSIKPTFILKAQLVEMVKELNLNFAAKNLTYNIMPEEFKSVRSGDTKIRFVFDPEKDLTIKTTDKSFNPNNYDSRYVSKGGVAPVDPLRKINVHIYNSQKSFGTTPGTINQNTNPELEGIDLSDSPFVIGEVLAGGSAGSTLTHEMGHFLGLEHTFENPSNEYGDYIDDTPPQSDNSNNVKVTLSPFTAIYSKHYYYDKEFRHMNVNFMDYSYVTRMFTIEQKKRMQYWLTQKERSSYIVK